MLKLLAMKDLFAFVKWLNCLGGGMLRGCWFMVLIGILAPVEISCGANEWKGTLNQKREFSHRGVDYTINFTDSPSVGIDHSVSIQDVEDVETCLRDSYDTFVDVMGFLRPRNSDKFEVNIYELPPGKAGLANLYCIDIKASVLRNNPGIPTPTGRNPSAECRSVVAHEMFHTIQYAYLSLIHI